MSVDVYLYVGPHLEVEVAIVQHETDACKCPKSCPNMQGAVVGYCSLCGIKLSNRYGHIAVESPQVDSWELLKGFKESLIRIGFPEYCPSSLTSKRHCFVSNITKPGQPREWHIEDHKSLLEDWSNLDIQMEMEWFSKAFALEMEAIKQAYGGINLKWGLLRWYN